MSARGFQMVVPLILALTVGCGRDDAGTRSTELPGIDTAAILLTAEPAEAKGVIEVREHSSDGDEVVVVGRIGGSANPWIEGVAAFTIVDPSLKSCAEIGDDMCDKPWDYC